MKSEQSVYSFHSFFPQTWNSLASGSSKETENSLRKREVAKRTKRNSAFNLTVKSIFIIYFKLFEFLWKFNFPNF